MPSARGGSKDAGIRWSGCEVHHPFVQALFLSADELAAAMQARCYNEHRTLPELAFTRRDGMARGRRDAHCRNCFLP
jgi:hypothetical protein